MVTKVSRKGTRSYIKATNPEQAYDQGEYDAEKGGRLASLNDPAAP
jgi:hypothetical protein